MKLSIDRAALAALAEETALAALSPRERFHPEEGVRADEGEPRREASA